MKFATFLSLLTFLFSTSVFAQKPVEPSALEIGQDPVFADAGAADQLDGAIPTFKAFYLNAEVGTGDAVDIARSYLRSRASSFGFTAGKVGDLEHVFTHEGPAGTTVRFRQTVNGVPVWGPHTVVNLDNDKRVQAVLTPQAVTAKVNTSPSFGEAAAEAAVRSHLDAQNVRVLEKELLILPGDEARLAWQVSLSANVESRPGFSDWVGLVDAQTGKLIRVADRTFYHDRSGDDDDKKGASPRPLIPLAVSMVDGTATTFDPDPLTVAGATYGDPGFSDNGDADSPELTDALMSVVLPDITFDGTDYWLQGTYAHIVDVEAPNDGLFEQDSPDWDYTRGEDAFEAALVYYHIDHYMRYINEDLGIEVMPFIYSEGVHFDPHGFNGADNSRYSSAAQDVSFGEGGVDDSEDADVVIHELGHGIHDWLTGGNLSQVEGLSEGVGDYFAASYTRSLGLLEPSDASYNWVFKWDGHNEFWPGRVVDTPQHYPEDLGGGIHDDGQMWGSANIQIWDEIGREKTDAAMIEGLGMTNSSTSQPEAAEAVLQAAVNMGYTQPELQSMYNWYTARGYNVTPVGGVFGEMTVSPPLVTAGDTVTFMTTIENFDSDPVSGIEFSNVLPEDLIFAGNISASTGTASETGGTVTWTFDLGGDDTATLSFDAQVSEETTVEEIENTATVTNTGGDDLALSATVQIGNPPENDDIEDAVVLTTSGTYSGTNVDATLEEGESEPSCTFQDWTTNSSVWWTFTATGDGMVTIDTNGSELSDTILTLLNASSLSEVACDDDGGDGLHSLIEDAPVSSGETYLIRVAGYNESGGGHQGALQLTTDFAFGSADEATPEEITEGLSAPTPNPVSGITTFKVAVETGQDVTVEVFDVTGRRVMSLYDGALAAGMSETLALDASTLPAGVYVIRAVGEDFAKTRRVTVVR